MSDDLVNENYSDPFIRKVVNFIASDSFQTKFENFFLLHSIKFSDADEHQFHYYELYQQFQLMFDQELELFCRQNEINKETFYNLCKEAIENDDKANHYVQILISSIEYETFVRLMRIMKPIAEIKLKNNQSQVKKKGMKGLFLIVTFLHPTTLLPTDEEDEEDVKGNAKAVYELEEYSTSEYESESKTPSSSRSKPLRKDELEEDEEADEKGIAYDDDVKRSKK
jgi:hypothetical protein